MKKDEFANRLNGKATLNRENSTVLARDIMSLQIGVIRASCAIMNTLPAFRSGVLYFAVVADQHDTFVKSAFAVQIKAVCADGLSCLTRCE